MSQFVFKKHIVFEIFVYEGIKLQHFHGETALKSLFYWNFVLNLDNLQYFTKEKKMFLGKITHRHIDVKSIGLSLSNN